MTLRLTMPWPISVNSLYRSFEGRQIISVPGRKYYKACKDHLASIKELPNFGEARLKVVIRLYPPTLGRYDIDNHAKCLLDGITHSKRVWVDDAQIDDLRIIRMKKAGKTNARAELVITVIPSKEA